MPTHKIHFVIEGYLEVSAETSDEAFDMVRTWTTSTIIDNAIDLYVEIETSETRTIPIIKGLL